MFCHLKISSTVIIKIMDETSIMETNETANISIHNTSAIEENAGQNKLPAFVQVLI